VDRREILPRTAAMQPGDQLIGLPSSGPHTNGYSLIHRLIESRDLAALIEPGGPTLADALLAPHRCYLADLDRLNAAGIHYHGLAHITGGGLVDNLPRVLPPHLVAAIDPISWNIPPLFARLMSWGELELWPALRIFNLGIGMIVIAPQTSVAAICAQLPDALVIGQLVARTESQERVLLTA
jgi:phosphoribosylformylglycinamidine cyclo-ligase